MKSDDEIIRDLGPGSTIHATWAKRLSPALKIRLDNRIIRNGWRLEPGRESGQYVIVAGRPTEAIIELEMHDGRTRSIYVSE